ncbi:MAG: GNAT family N-acetyltransferase [Bacillota bacterium]
MDSHECLQITVRAATLSDIPFIQDIARRTWTDTYRGVIAEDAQAAVLGRAYSKEALTVSIGRGQAFLVAEVCGGQAVPSDPAVDGDSTVDSVPTVHCSNDRLAGYVDVDYDGRQANLHRLYVLPEYQRLGLGKRLLQEAVAQTLARLPAGSSCPLVAYVERDNTRARAFYKKMGFAEGEEEIVIIGGISLPVIRISMTVGGDGSADKDRSCCG